MISREITYHRATEEDGPILRRTLFFRKQVGDPPVSTLVESTIFCSLPEPGIVEWTLDLDLLEYLSLGLPPDLDDALPVPPRLRGTVLWKTKSLLPGPTPKRVRVRAEYVRATEGG